MKNIEEILKVCNELEIKVELVPKEKAVPFIHDLFQKYSVQKTTGHLAIHHDSTSLPLEPYEFTYSSYLKDEPVYVLFDQKGSDKEWMILIEEPRKVGEIFENAFGMEYFLTNDQTSFLLAVNWYVIEGAGEAKNWMNPLL